jgi:gas vesicle protein
MDNENQKTEYHKSNNVVGVLFGMLVGGFAGALTMLLMAPQSGKDTRMQIQEKGIELRDRTAGIVEDVMAQVRMERNKLTTEGRKKAKELIHQGRELAVEQLDRVSEAALAGKKAIQNS